ncbi:MAG: sulfatase-like hydrolase/transferase [Rikenellaceae bacterium]
MQSKLIFTAALSCAAVAASNAAYGKSSSGEEGVNVIVIVADDMGYSATSVYGAKAPYDKLTPNLDQFGREGIIFKSGYVSASTSGPSRAGILTGRYQQRYGIYSNCDLQARGAGVPVEAKMMPAYFKKAGYKTAALGKWHGGHTEGKYPLDKGFDSFWGFCSAQTNFFALNDPEIEAFHYYKKPAPIMDGRKKVTDHGYLTYELTDRAVDFIKKNKDDKFMLYLAYSAVHDPLQAPQAEIAKHTNIPDRAMKIRAAMLNTLDRGVGEVMQALKDCGIDDNTMVVFISDNGGLPNWWNGNNGELRGNKRERWDGGMRVQYMMRYPKVIDAGQQRDQIVSSIDILPTALSVANIKYKSKEFDGIDMSNLFKGGYSENIHDCLFWAGGNAYHENKRMMPIPAPGNHDNPPAAWAVRTPKWKLVHFEATGKTHLFDMSVSAREEDSFDVAAKHPEVIAELTQQWVKWFKGVNTKPVAWNDVFYSKLTDMLKK